MFFASDNWAGAAPQIVEAIAREAARFGAAYGDSDLDRAVQARFNEVFERETTVFFVATGSAANALALVSANRPGGVVFCHRESHILEDECGAVEYLSGGGRLSGIGGAEAKLDPDLLRSALSRLSAGSVHAGQPMAVSITQQTEAGGIYSPDEIAAISAITRDSGLPLHMDGARFANALVRLGRSPADMTWKAGVDVLSFGGTKNGCVGAEALVFFDPELARQGPYLRKRAGQLFSKARFIAAQFDAYFRDDLWLNLARHANAMADRLRGGIEASASGRQAWRTEGNEIFAFIPRRAAERLREAGAKFYDWHPPTGVAADPDDVLVRLVTSFATTIAEVDQFVALLAPS